MEYKDLSNWKITVLSSVALRLLLGVAARWKSKYQSVNDYILCTALPDIFNLPPCTSLPVD